MKQVEAVVIGAGQAGLALSRCLIDRGVGHVVLERGRVAERWRSERWESLRLLSPNWQTRLPHFTYAGSDPDGFMTVQEVVDFLTGYADSFAAPVEERTMVERVSRAPRGFIVATSRGLWVAPVVAIATGYCDRPAVPAWADRIPAALHQVTPSAYRSPAHLPDGGVLVVGGSATGVQLAHELRRDGRTVVLAVGRHIRLPRSYRGRDILWWLDRMGVLDDTLQSVADPEAARTQPSFQLVGRPDHASMTLAGLQDDGVTIVGRLLGIDGSVARFDDSLVRATVAADVKLVTVLQRIDAFAEAHGINTSGERLDGFTPLWPRFVEAPAALDLNALGVTNVLWATGFARDYSWLRLPDALDENGEVRHTRGVTPIGGLYIIGLPFLHRRNSAFLDGVGRDAEPLAAEIARYLGQLSGRVA
jgi:putative flavoprotein involved in K+ transport